MQYTRINRPSLAWAGAPATPAILTRLGAQSYSFRHFDFDGTLQCMKDLGLNLIEYCGVHFPPDTAAPAFPDIQRRLAESNIRTICFGVEQFANDAAANRRRFEFARALGIQILTADPAPDAFDQLDALCDEFQIKIAIHNHGPGARYDKVADTIAAVRGRHPFIGACVDTGHCIRSGEAPGEVIRRLGARVHSLHLKDWIQGGEEQIAGEGDLDLSETARALDAIAFHGPIIMEYELSPENPIPGMRTGLRNWQEAVAAL